MTPFWLLFLAPAFASFFENDRLDFRVKGEKSLFAITIVVFCVLIGMRFEVGGDWITYAQHLESAYYINFDEIPTSGDPGYVLVNWVAARFGADVWFTNLFCAVFFSWGLCVFALNQPRPWLALSVSVPYLVTVVAMGYTRQGVAIGFAMLALVSLGKQRSTTKFVFWIIVAATFHKSAVLLIPIAALANERGRLWTLTWVAAATAIAYFTLLESSVDNFVSGYLEADYQSSGAAVRIAMNALPATIFLLFHNRFIMNKMEKRLWIIMASIALLMVPALILSSSSTAVDRLALYLIPLQLVVLSRVPSAFASSQRSAGFMASSVIVYSGAVLFVWLNFASHADAWLPYQFYPL